MRMMRWAIATTATLPLVGTMASGAVAQAPSPDPPPWFGGRVEMPEHGFALTVPDGWVALDPAGDVPAQMRIVHETWFDHLVGYPLTPESLLLVMHAGPSVEWEAQYCDVWSRSQSLAASIIDNARRDVTIGDEDPEDDWEFRDVRTVETAHATATVVDATMFPGVGDEGINHADYYFPLRDEVTTLECTGYAFRPDDDWLSIAETFEFLPAE